MTESETSSPPVELLHPFYLDTDMCMAFSAALSGGVALQEEEVAKGGQESEAIRKLRGNLRVFDVIGLGGERGSKDAESSETESRLIRHHTEASIFIALHDELQRTGQLQSVELAQMKAGDIVSIGIGPAFAPLRRIVEQVLRLFDVVFALSGLDPDQGGELPPNATRQERRQHARERAKQLEEGGDDSDGMLTMHEVFTALHEDLDRSGMVDVVVSREDEPSVVLTLDKRFASERTLELLHTSQFTVIGKVTQVWPEPDEFVNLYRRSVLSLAPSLVQTVSWNMLGFLIALAKSLDVEQTERQVKEAAGEIPESDQIPSEEQDEAADNGEAETGEPDDQAAAESTDSSGDDSGEVMLGEDAINAVTPGVSGPAFQILPLAICA